MVGKGQENKDGQSNCDRGRCNLYDAECRLDAAGAKKKGIKADNKIDPECCEFCQGYYYEKTP